MSDRRKYIVHVRVRHFFFLFKIVWFAEWKLTTCNDEYDNHSNFVCAIIFCIVVCKH